MANRTISAMNNYPTITAADAWW